MLYVKFKIGEHGLVGIGIMQLKKTEKGLELKDIDLNTPGLILIGREYMHSSGDNELRRQMCSNLNIKIHSYDWLFRVGSGIDGLTLLELDRK